jgi:hypothetical protein
LGLECTASTGRTIANFRSIDGKSPSRAPVALVSPLADESLQPIWLGNLDNAKGQGNAEDREHNPIECLVIDHDKVSRFELHPTADLGTRSVKAK